MKYIVYKKHDNRVLHILDKEPISISDNLGVARCENIPTYNETIGEYLEVFNIQPQVEKYFIQEPIEVVKTDEEGNEYADTENVEVEKERNYFTCILVVKTDEKFIKIKRLNLLRSWFDNEYRYYNEKLTRFMALNIVESVNDKVFGLTYLSIEDLYIQAEKVRAEIKDLEK